MLTSFAIAFFLAAKPAPVEPPSKADVVKALATHRAHNLASFRAYRNGGVYPHNYVRRGPLNVWKDRDGHLCAAATMIDKDGQHDLVTATAQSNNFIRLLDVTEGPLMDWVLTSGFTIEEIDRIQEPMMMRDEPAPDYKVADANLAKDYAKTDTWLTSHAKSSLDVAASRLLENPGLARRLVDETL